MKSAVLYLVFNRIDETKESFETIRKAKPPKLYVAADGPRNAVNGEREICDAVRKIATNVDWDCEVLTLFREENLGCKTAIVIAIDWFFENEPEGIILEDDIIPKNEFFEFCDIMLEKYRNENVIKAVSGFNQFGQNIESNSYYFSRGFYAWGWATWKSRWSNYKVDNLDMSLLESREVKSVYHKAAIEGVKFNLNIIQAGVLDTWDYQMLYMIMVENGRVVAPLANLTTNIGANGAHSMNNQNIFFKYGEMSINDLVHPSKIEDNQVLNEKLWEEFKAAYLGVRFKDLLMKLRLYVLLRGLYKKVMKFYIAKFK
ncbi:nucleotide-diphospho-sugar transferase [Pedobacter xixiisoli]|uniref:Uncharacterized protein n=1 Tax=Pedobacter xixiisoli TaxID=1476464 RepID=A0A286AEL5_9SPHI|nr:nucleotide-diphospho-sugar transferase [Pedobacter xixiisoli]SOD20339.1 hypothetical protein SAMN06297358_4055 [Pedobacter xixiisoli]